MKVFVLGRGKLGRALHAQLTTRGVEVSLLPARSLRATAARGGARCFVLAVPDAAIRAVNDLPRAVAFVLWGKFAQKKAALIDASRHAVIAGVHPSPLSAHAGFFGSQPFSKVNEALSAAGQAPIDWRLPRELSEEGELTSSEPASGSHSA